MKHIAVMIKPASSLCNLRCRYCFYAEVSDSRQVRSFGVMQEDTARRMIQNIFTGLTAGDRVSLSFQGGEPTLAGLDFFRVFVAEVKQVCGNVQVAYAIQTNGTLLNDDWCVFLRENHFLVGLSLDAISEIHNQNRLDAKNQGTYSRVMATKAMLEKYGVEFNVLTVLTNTLARHPQQVWKFLCGQDIHYVQFIPCLGELDGSASVFSLTPERFAHFYFQIFKLWSADFEKGKYRSIKLFDDLVNLLATGSRNACGITGQCMPQIVVEADGSVYPCDFYAIDEFRVGNLAEAPIEEICMQAAMAEFRNRPTEKMTLCKSCPYVPICGGGCPRMRREVCGASDADSCGYRIFLDHCLPQMQKYAYWERTARVSSERGRASG